jgi:alcohol dehydrogenase
MPYVLAMNRVAIEGRIKRLAAYLDLDPSFGAFFEAVLKLRSELKVPHTLAEFGIPADKRLQIADMAIVDPTAGGNPVELTRERALEVFDRAMGGEL